MIHIFVDPWVYGVEINVDGLRQTSSSSLSLSSLSGQPPFQGLQASDAQSPHNFNPRLCQVLCKPVMQSGSDCLQLFHVESKLLSTTETSPGAYQATSCSALEFSLRLKHRVPPHT